VHVFGCSAGHSDAPASESWFALERTRRIPAVARASTRGHETFEPAVAVATLALARNRAVSVGASRKTAGRTAGSGRGGTSRLGRERTGEKREFAAGRVGTGAFEQSCPAEAY